MSTHTLSPKTSNESLQSSSSVFSSPDKLAPALTGPMVWEELDATTYIHELSPREVQDIRAAVIKVKSTFQARHRTAVANDDQLPVHQDPRSDRKHLIWRIQR
jgi:hypothetical protein